MTERTNQKAFVLIVEDDPGNQELTVRQLGLLGFETASVPGGAEAVAVVERDSPILVLMDSNMPGMNGIEASRAIRALPRGGSVPIVAVTADTNEATREAFLEAGANEVVHRPVLLDDLRGVVARWVGPVADGSAGTSEAGLLSRLRGDIAEASVQRIVGMYLESLDGRTAAISTAVLDGDPTALRDAAHALRSATSVFDEHDLSGACAALESLGESGSVEGADAPLQELMRFAAELRALLEAARDANGPPPSDRI